MGVIKELAAETRDLPLSEGMRREAQGFIRCIGERGRRRGRDRVPREAQARVHRAMKAAVLHETGTPLSVEDVPEPEAGDGQSIVDVKAAGINFADVLIKNGHYPQPPQLPTVLGNEVAGEIDGRRVVAFARLTGGGYAERVAVDDEWVFDLPAEASYAEGAAFLTTYLTAWIPLIRQARIQPGSKVLVTRGGGRRRHGRDPGGRLLRRERHRGRRLGGEAGARARPRRAATVATRRSASSTTSTSRSTRSAAPCSPRASRRAARSASRSRSASPAGLGAGRPGAARRPQHRRLRLLPRPADGLRRI